MRTGVFLEREYHHMDRWIMLFGVLAWLSLVGMFARSVASAPPDHQQEAQTSTARQETPLEVPKNAPKLVVDPPHVDLGVVRQGGIYDFSYAVTNAGQSNLLIRRIRSTCGCTVTRPDKPEVLKPGERLIINANFDSAGKIGHKQYHIEVYSNDPVAPQARLTFEAEIEAVYQLKPNIELLRFDNKRRGETLDRTLSLLAGKKDAQIEIVDLSFSNPGISYAAEPIVERGYNGYRLSFTLHDDVPIGPYQTDMRIKVRSDGEEDELALPFDGQVVSDITVKPPYLLEVAPVMPGEPITYGRITLQAVNRGMPFRIRKVDAGEQLTYAIEETQPGLEYRITFSVARTAEKGPFARKIVILTNNKEQPVITVPVYVNIGSPVEVRPEIVYLRRQPGDPASGGPAAQTVTIRSPSAKSFTIEGASSDNRNFLVTFEQPDQGGSDRKLVVTLAESASVGQYEGMVTVFTDLEGAKELKILLYGEVVEDR